MARMIRAKVEGRTPPGGFAYRHLGSRATIGRKAAVADYLLEVMAKPMKSPWLSGAVITGTGRSFVRV